MLTREEFIRVCLELLRNVHWDTVLSEDTPESLGELSRRSAIMLRVFEDTVAQRAEQLKAEGA